MKRRRHITCGSVKVEMRGKPGVKNRTLLQRYGVLAGQSSELKILYSELGGDTPVRTCFVVMILGPEKNNYAEARPTEKTVLRADNCTVRDVWNSAVLMEGREQHLTPALSLKYHLDETWRLDP